MNAVETGDLVARILAMSLLAVAVGGGIWAVAEFIVYMIRWKRGRKKR